MKLKNITSSKKVLTNLETGERISVEGKKTIEINRASYNGNAFSIVTDKDKPKIEIKTDIEQIEEIKMEKEVY